MGFCCCGQGKNLKTPLERLAQFVKWGNFYILIFSGWLFIILYSRIVYKESPDSFGLVTWVALIYVFLFSFVGLVHAVVKDFSLRLDALEKKK